MAGREEGVAAGGAEEIGAGVSSRDSSRVSSYHSLQPTAQTVIQSQLPIHPTAATSIASIQRQAVPYQEVTHPTAAPVSHIIQRPQRSKSRGRSRGPSRSSQLHPTAVNSHAHIQQLSNNASAQINPTAAPVSTSIQRPQHIQNRGRSRGPSKSSSSQSMVTIPPMVQPSKDVRKWTDLFKSTTTATLSPNPQSLSYVPPVNIDGKLCGVVSEKGVRTAVARWDRVLVGYVIGARPQAAGLAKYVKWLWQLKGFIEVQHRGNGFFLFKFSNESELCKVLEGGPWFICARPLVLQRWDPDSNFEHQRLTSLPLWVRLPLLPLRFWSKEAMAAIGSMLGVPLMMDTPTTKGTRLEYARLCVEIGLDFAYPTSVPLFNASTNLMEYITVEYEWKPTPCIHCQTYGHLEEACMASHLAKGKAPLNTTTNAAAVMQWRVVTDNRRKGIVIAEPTHPVTLADDEDEVVSDFEDVGAVPLVPSSEVLDVIPSSATTVVLSPINGQPQQLLASSSLPCISGANDVVEGSSTPCFVSTTKGGEQPNANVVVVPMPTNTVGVEDIVDNPLFADVEVSKEDLSNPLAAAVEVVPSTNSDLGVRTRSRTEVDPISIQGRADSTPRSRLAHKETIRLQMGPRDRRKEKQLREERAVTNKALSIPPSQ